MYNITKNVKLKTLVGCLFILAPITGKTDTVYVNAGDYAPITVGNMLSQGTEHRIYKNASVSYAYDGVLDSQSDTNTFLRFTGTELTDNTYGQYLQSREVSQYEANMIAQTLGNAVQDKWEVASAARNYALYANQLMQYSVAQTTTQIVVTNLSSYAGGNITNDIYVVVSNYVDTVVSNYINVVCTNIIENVGGNEIVTNIYDAIQSALLPADWWQPSIYKNVDDIRINIGNLESGLNLLLSSNNQALADILTYLRGSLNTYLSTISGDVVDIYNLTEYMAENLDHITSYTQSNNYRLEQAVNLLTTLVANSAATNSNYFAGEVSVTNRVDTDAYELLARNLRNLFWVYGTAYSKNYEYNIITNVDAAIPNVVKSVRNNYRIFLQDTVDSQDMSANGYYSLTSYGSSVSDGLWENIDRIPYILWGDVVNGNYLSWLNYYTSTFGGIMSNEFATANSTLFQISNIVEQISGAISNLDFSVSNDVKEIYQNYTGEYNRVVHSTLESLTNNFEKLVEHLHDDPLQFYTNTIWNGSFDPADRMNWFERVELLLFAIAGGGEQTNGFENTTINEEELYNTTNNVGSDLRGILGRFGRSDGGKDSITNDIMGVLKDISDAISENSELKDYTVHWLPESAIQGEWEYLSIPFSTNDTASWVCGIFRKIFLLIWWFSFAFLSWAIAEKLIHLSWKVLQYVYSTFSRLLG